ncbi:MAG: GAF domain-containing protein [Cyclobacteriaceae bacterium]
MHTEMVKHETENLFQVIRSIDISIRGYALMQDKHFLFYDPKDARNENYENFKRLDSLLKVENYEGRTLLPAMEKSVGTYIDLYENMIAAVEKNDSLQSFKVLLSQDVGGSFQFWDLYNGFAPQVLAYEKQQNEKAQAEYESAMKRNIIIQVLLLLVGAPTLIMLLVALRNQAKRRIALLKNLQQNNREYLFDEGGASLKSEDDEENQTQLVLNKSIADLKKAAEFVAQITGGNYHIEWDELNDANRALNRHNLAGHLIAMRDQMKKIKAEDEKRLWSTLGLSQFAEITRQQHENLQKLCDEAITFIVKYLKVEQGGIFRVIKEDELILKLTSCYAFNRKKHIEHTLEPGQGLAGQAYLEAQTIHLTEVPPGYTTITSGLGESAPHAIIIIPCKHNEVVEAILEIASLRSFAVHEIEFLEKIGETLALTLIDANNTEKMKAMVTELQIKTETMQAQEEEMRQSLEELQATQEEMERRTREVH